MSNQSWDYLCRELNMLSSSAAARIDKIQKEFNSKLTGWNHRYFVVQKNSLR